MKLLTIATVIWLALAATVLPGTPPHDGNADTSLADSICASYAQIDTLSCEIRKTTHGGGHTIRMLSRVHYKTPDHIHVDNVTPMKRTIIADGKQLYYYQAGAKLGFSRPIGELSELWTNRLRIIPATPVERLLPLKGIPEDELPPTQEHAVRRGYLMDGAYAVLSLDDGGRMARIETFRGRDLAVKTGTFTFSRYEEPVPGCWIPTLHKAKVMTPDGETVEETRRISRLSVNTPIPNHLFNYKLFLQDVEFTDDFEKTYRQQ